VFSIAGLGFRVLGLGFTVWDLGFRYQSLSSQMFLDIGCGFTV